MFAYYNEYEPYAAWRYLGLRRPPDGLKRKRGPEIAPSLNSCQRAYKAV
jgi:hypothetical protein